MADQLTPELSDGIIDFSLNLYKLSTNGNENIFMSPYSIAACLMLADLGANAHTDDQIRQALGVHKVEKETVHKDFHKLEERLVRESGANTCLNVANRMFIKLGFKVDEKYASDAKQFYGSQVQQLDFSGDPKGSVHVINEWVEDQTRGKIKDLVTSGGVNSESFTMLVSAIYFKGNWYNKFAARRTCKEAFTVNNTDVQMVEMMKDKRSCKTQRLEKLKSTALALPYQGKDTSMIFIRPDDSDGLANLENSLTGNCLATLCRHFDERHCLVEKFHVGIPKFKMESSYQLKDSLRALGIRDMFDSNAADFSAVLPANPDAYVTDFMHKSVIEVNEAGTEAAAAVTAMKTYDLFESDSRRKKFILDHPFMFLVWNQSTSTILFIGRYVRPPPGQDISLHSTRRCIVL